MSSKCCAACGKELANLVDMKTANYIITGRSGVMGSSKIPFLLCHRHFDHFYKDGQFNFLNSFRINIFNWLAENGQGSGIESISASLDERNRFLERAKVA